LGVQGEVHEDLHAQQAMPDGGRLEITSEPWLEPDDGPSPSERRPGPYCRICVRDSGRGMDSETLRQIFEPFFTTRTREGGTGLGLSTVRGVIRRHGGSIEVESAPGQGTGFRLYLPRTEARSPVHPPEPREGPRRGGVESIWVVEDDAAIRRMVATLLESAGHPVRTFERGEEAVAAAAARSEAGQEDGPDLLVTDWSLPGIDGRQTFELLRAARPRLRALLTSGHSDAVVGSADFGSGMSFLAKPFTRRALLGKVHEILAREVPAADGSGGPSR